MSASLTLAIGAVEGRLHIAVGNRRGRLVYGRWIEAASSGAERLTPAIREALSSIRKRVDDIAKIAVVRGPGGFTGLRLATTTSAGLARAVGAKQAGLDHMRLVARDNLPRLTRAPEGSLLWALVHARRDLVYMQAFAYDGSANPPLYEAASLSVSPVSTGEAAGLILGLAFSSGRGASPPVSPQAHDGQSPLARLHAAPHILLAGSGAREHRAALAADLAVPGAPRVSFLEERKIAAETLLAEALDVRYGNEDIDPLYIRPSDAEENLPRIAERLGLDPVEAVRKLHAITGNSPGVRAKEQHAPGENSRQPLRFS